MNLSSLALSLIALSLGSAVLAGPLNIEMTNAKRLKMGLGPMAPRALYNPSGMFILLFILELRLIVTSAPCPPPSSLRRRHSLETFQSSLFRAYLHDQ